MIRVHQKRSDFGRYEITAPKSAPKTVTTSFAANLLARLVDFMPIYLFLRLTLCKFTPLGFETDPMPGKRSRKH